MANLRVLVCGGRDFENKNWLFRVLDEIHQREGGGIGTLIHGNARGADNLAAWWADCNKVVQMAFPADWGVHGKAAGPIRNAKMLELGRPDLCVAFPGGAGTRDMARKCIEAGVEVTHVTAC